jgi:uridylate kinase
MSNPISRVMLKLSGEALMGTRAFGIDPEHVTMVAKDIHDLVAEGVGVAVVVGAGNFFRGVSESAAGMDRATADYMGMIATTLNALPIQDALEQLGTQTRVMSAIPMNEVAEPYIRRRAVRHLEKGRVVIFAAGTGNPYFTTDTAAALRALEINADAIFMAKNGVDGVYDCDPRTNPDAEFISDITHSEAVSRGLRVMDTTALTLCGENRLPIHVFNMDAPGSIVRLARGERLGTLVHTPTSD